MRRIITILLIIVLIFVVIFFSNIYLGQKIISSKIADSCNMRLRIICNRFYRHAIASELEFPTTVQWCDKMIADSEKDILICSGRGNADIKCNYAINRNIKKYKFNDLPDDLVLFFESDLGWNGIGYKNDVDYSNHSKKLAGIVMVDGEIIHAPKETVDNLKWD